MSYCVSLLCKRYPDLDHYLGHLGHLTLTIPWANIMTKPAEIVIEDVFLVAIPAAESKVSRFFSLSTIMKANVLSFSTIQKMMRQGRKQRNKND